MLVIRLARRGRKKQPFYDLVVAEKARAVTKKFVKKLGYYNPLKDNGKGEFVYEEDLVTFYVDNGAQMSQTAARLLAKYGFEKAKKFIKPRPTKPKKEAPKEEAAEKEEGSEEEKA